MKPIASVFPLAYPAFLLLFGMIFGLAAVHFIGVSWSRWMTITLYAIPLLWGLALAWRARRHLLPITALDALFVGFVVWVAASLVFQGGLQSGAGSYARFLPFMVTAPYLCGRLMRVHDMELLSRIVMYAGLAILPLLLLGYMASPDGGSSRGTFFGQDHGALLVGALLAAALLALCVRAAASRNSGGGFKSRLLHYGLFGLTTGFLVWVSARGWLVAAIAGLAVLVLSAYRGSGLRGTYSRQLAFVVAVVLLSLAVLPHPTSQFYAQLLTAPQVAGPTQVAGPILGEESCLPLKEGENSVAIRWLLYREAVAMFVQFPTLGVGAGRFGERSCTGSPWFPHSTVLQALSELGLVGGGLLLGLLILAALALARPFVFSERYPRAPAHFFALALFAAFLVADQLHGNYFVSIGTYLMLGLAAGMLADEKRGRVAHV